MTGPEHCAEAERLLAKLGAEAPTEIIKAVAALAQVHATLALVAEMGARQRPVAE